MVEKDLRAIVNQAKGNVSLALSTNDGEMHIQSEVEKSAASIIKVPIALACLQAAEEGTVDLDETVNISEPVGGTGVLNYLYGVTNISLKNALALSIIVSDNIGANIVIDAVGMEQADQFFQNVGATHTAVKRKFMDHDALANGIDNVTSARDMNLFLQLLDDTNDTLSIASKKLMREIMQHQQLKDKLPAYQNMFAEEVVIGNKTGTLNGVEHDVAYFKRGDATTYVSVLATDLTHNYDGQQTIAQIGQKVLEYMS